MEFGDERKIPNLYTGEFFGQFPNRGRQVERVKKPDFKMELENTFSNRAGTDRMDIWRKI